MEARFSRMVVAFTSTLFLLVCVGPAATAPRESGLISGNTFTLEQLCADYQVVRNIVNRVNPLAFADRAALNAIMNDQEGQLREGMGELEFCRVLAPVVAAIQCGHTGLHLPSAFGDLVREKGRYLPFIVRAIGDELYVVDPLAVPGLPAGARISRINGRSAKQILGTFLAGMSSDGGILSRKYVVINGAFNDTYLMLVESPVRFTVGFIEPGSDSERLVETDAISRGELDTLSRLAARPYVRAPLLPYECSFPGSGVALLTIRTFVVDAFNPLQCFQEFLGTFFTAVRGRGVHNLILDLRDNWGGDPAASSALYRYLIREPAPYFAQGTSDYPFLTEPLQPEPSAFEGNLYVLINGASFSSTGHLCSLLRFHNRATFVGEETGGTFTCTDESMDLVLPETHIILRTSTKEFRTAVTGMTPGRGIVPDYPAVPTITDVLDRRDIPMEIAVRLATVSP
jgi:hypothetical protein